METIAAESAGPMAEAAATELPTPAPLGRRLLAFALDYSLWATAWMTILGGLAVPGTANQWIARGLVGLGAVGLVAYCVVSWVWLWRYGQSIGKRAYGVAARGHSGERPSLWRLMGLRNLLFLGASLVPFVGGVSYVIDHALGLRSNRRCLHDVIAGTQVIAVEELPAGRPSLAISVVTVLWTILSVLAALTLFVPLETSGPSNEPTLLHGDRFMALRPLPLVGPHVALGDVVVLVNPVEGMRVVKRVFGMPGDSIAIRDGWVIRNGAALPRTDAGPCTGFRFADSNCRLYETELAGRKVQLANSTPGRTSDEVTVPDGHVYVLGDHLDRSHDSSDPAFGPIPLENVEGMATVIYWSADDGTRWDRILTAVRQ